ncbi:MAG: DNA repair protein RadA [Microcoleaceae cyanobacterium]
MPKSRTFYACQECGNDFPQYFGRCPSCHAWNSLQEQLEQPTATALPRTSWSTIPVERPGHPREDRDNQDLIGQPRAAYKLSEVSDQGQSRRSSGFEELDRVLGGGIVPGSLVLIGGEPGIGKSTLLLQVANCLSLSARVLYVSAEESAQQIKLRAQRLGVGLISSREPSPEHPSKPTHNHQESLLGEDLAEELPVAQDHPQGQRSRTERSAPEPFQADPELYLLPETDLEVILRELESLKPQLAVIDSIQTIYFASLASAPGSVAQVRECTSALMQVAKRENITLFLVGHVTKDGLLAGPRVLEHLVDTVLYFEGDRFAAHRLLRSMKNRFGATHEIGVFEMVAEGLKEVPNPSELFLGSRDDFAPGTATVVAVEGTRPIVVEVQALVSPTSYGSARRATTGVDNGRLLQILAVLEKRVGIPLSKLDAYVASVGGLRVDEPAVDLGVAIAIVASFRDRVVDAHTVLIGEVGLGGQVRPVSQLELRLREATKLGFKRAIVPKGQLPTGLEIEIVPVNKVLDAIVAAMPVHPETANSHNN